MGSSRLWTLCLLTAALGRVTNGVTLEMPSSKPYLRDSVTVRCVGFDMRNVSIYKDGSMVKSDRIHQINRTISVVELKISAVSETDKGDYSCVSNGNKKHNQKTLWLKDWRRSITLTPSRTTISEQETVTLNCYVEDYPNIQWLRRRFTADSYFEILTEYSSSITVSRGGVYSCRGVREGIITEESKKVTVTQTGVTLEMPHYSIYLGDSVTVRCVGSDVRNVNIYKDGSMVQSDRIHQINRTIRVVELKISAVSETDKGDYSCVRTRNKKHNQKTLYVKGRRRSITLTPSSTSISGQETVILNCYVEDYPNLQLLRRRFTADSYVEILTEYSSSITVSRGGVYSCRGVHEGMITAESDAVTVRQTGLPLQMPLWAYPGDTVTVRCEGPFNAFLHFFKDDVKVKKDTNHWFERTSNTNMVDLIIHSASASDGGLYSCGIKEETLYTGRSLQIHKELSRTIDLTTDNYFITNQSKVTLSCEISGIYTYEWIRRSSDQSSTLETLKEDTSTITVSHGGLYSCRGRGKAVPVLSVSPMWLSPGASVSLKCDITAPSAGWKFYWYQAVPLPSGSYSYKLLPGNSSGTTHGSFTVNGLSSTAGFVCRAARGSPEVYTQYSPPQFVWSADTGSRVSPTVRPYSSQHLTFDPVSVSCGSSDEDWRVQMFSLSSRSLDRCQSHTNGEKHECQISTENEIRAVFWCESGSGEMTDAVNVSIHNSVILLIPAQPVPEGHSVSVVCKVGHTSSLSSIHFYKDEQLIQEGSSTTYDISALTKSDEGLYKCSLHLTSNRVQTSPESWLSVRLSDGRSSSVPVLLLVLVGVACLLVFLTLLLLLWCCRNKKDTCCKRSQKTDQTSAEDHVTTAYPPDEVAYSQLELKGRTKREKEPEEIYSNVFTQAAADVDVMYSQINHYRKQTAKEKPKVKTPGTSAEETVYSEVRKTPFV